MKKAVAFVFAGATLALTPIHAEIAKPVRPTASEFSQWQSQQTQALQHTSWGKTVQEVERFRDRVAAPAKATASEISQLQGRTQDSMGTVIARGESSLPQRIALFIPDRILDLLDTVSFGAGPGVGLGTEVHVTRYMSLGLGAEAGVSLCWYYNRNLMIAPHYAMLACFGPEQAYTYSFSGAGTGWDKGQPGSGTVVFSKSGEFSEDDEICTQGWADPYGVGIGMGLEVHPVEVADFVVGTLTLGLVDISRDDYANPDQAQYKNGLPVGGAAPSTQSVVHFSSKADSQTQYLH